MRASSPSRGAHFGAAIGVALSLAVAAPVSARAEWKVRHPSGPSIYLAAGLAASDVGQILLFDAGLWIGPVLPTIVWRSTGTAASASTTLIGGRLDLGLNPTSWLSMHAGAGAGRLEYRADGASSSRTALLAGTTVTFGSDYFNLVGFGVEVLLPLGDRPSGPVQFHAAPSVMASITIQPLYLFAMK